MLYPKESEPWGSIAMSVSESVKSKLTIPNKFVNITDKSGLVPSDISPIRHGQHMQQNEE